MLVSRLQPASRYDINIALQQRSEFELEMHKVEDRRVRFELHEEVDVTGRAFIATSHRPEDEHFPGVMDCGEGLDIDGLRTHLVLKESHVTSLPVGGLEPGEARMTPPRRRDATASDLSPTIWTTSDVRRAQNSTRSLQPLQQNTHRCSTDSRISPNSRARLASDSGAATCSSSSTQSDGCARASRRRPCRFRQESSADHQ